MSRSIFEKNIEALSAIAPDAAMAVMSANGEPEGVEFSVAKSGMPTARYIDMDGRAVQLHSKYDPVKEADEFTKILAPGFGKWIFWLGPSLWYGVRSLKGRMFHCPVCVVEADPAMLRAVMERVPIDDVLLTPGVRVVTGSIEAIKSNLREKPIRLDSPRNTVVSPQAAATNPAAYEEIISFIECLSAEMAPHIDPENVVRAAAFGSLNPTEMRILITANDRYSDAVARTLTPLGVQVKNIFDLSDTGSMLEYNPTLLFAFTANLMRWPDTLILISGLKKALKIPLVVWNLEDPLYFFNDDQRERIIKTARFSDLFFTQSGQCLNLYEEAGIKAYYLPTGARPDMFGDPLPDGEQTLDFSFFGFWTQWRKDFFDKLIGKLSDLKFRLICPGMAPEDYRDMIRHTCVNLTAMTNCDIATGEHWALSDRVWEVPYAGGFLLQDSRKHIQDHFSEREVAVFTDMDDCAEKIRYYAAHPQERARILRAARARIRKEHLWAHRMEVIIGRLNTFLSAQQIL